MTQHSQNGEGVEVLRDSANSHCFDDRIMVAGECIAFASEPWSSKIAASLAREPATADVGREAVAREVKRVRFLDRYGNDYRADDERLDHIELDAADRILTALSRAAPSSEPAIAEGEYMSVTIDRAGNVTSHNAFDANFDEMVDATRKIITALQQRLDNHLKCPFAAGNALRATTPPTTNDAIPAGMVEALKPFLHAAEAILHNDRDRWQPDEWTRRAHLITVGQYRALHAAALSAAPSAPATEAGEEAPTWRFGYPDGIPGTPEYEPPARVCVKCGTVLSRCACQSTPTDQVKDGKGGGE